MLSTVSLYTGRITFAQNNLTTFQLRGTARLCGTNLVARGRFVLWGSADDCLLRGDFYGPDGSPILSMRADSSGLVMYFPKDETALFTPNGIQVGNGTIATRDLIFMLRTGFPMQLEPWIIQSGAIIATDCIRWNFNILHEADVITLEFEPDLLFPSRIFWEDGEISITAASPHDEYSAWPFCWEFQSGETEVELELTNIVNPAVPRPGIWNLVVPVHVDTLASMSLWKPNWDILQH